MEVCAILARDISGSIDIDGNGDLRMRTGRLRTTARHTSIEQLLEEEILMEMKQASAIALQRVPR